MPRTKLPSYKRRPTSPDPSRDFHPSKRSGPGSGRAAAPFTRTGTGGGKGRKIDDAADQPGSLNPGPKSKSKPKSKAKARSTAPTRAAATRASRGGVVAGAGGKPPVSPVGRRQFLLPREGDVEVSVGGRTVRLTNLSKPFWPELGITKADLLQYYADVSDVLLPHLADRAMVMKRYPHGASGEFFFMKRAPSPRPDWIELCTIHHASGNVIDFPMVQDVASLLWVINLGCIDLNQWYARCDDVDRPDYLHFDLDPVPGAGMRQVLDTALLVRSSLETLGMPCYAKTTGSKGIHVYVPIERGPTQKQVWTFAKELARALESRDPALVTAEYKIAKRPKGRVLVDYNQNAWGRTLASIYSVRPKPRASVSTPVTWEELEKGVAIEDFRIDNVPARIAKKGDLWKPLLAKTGRFRLEKFL